MATQADGEPVSVKILASRNAALVALWVALRCRYDNYYHGEGFPLFDRYRPIWWKFRTEKVPLVRVEPVSGGDLFEFHTPSARLPSSRPASYSLAKLKLLDGFREQNPAVDDLSSYVEGSPRRPLPPARAAGARLTQNVRSTSLEATSGGTIGGVTPRASSSRTWPIVRRRT